LTGAGRPGPARVSICIPAYQAEGFIERTLGCAASQTLSDVRILVSIDRSTDGTEEICRAFAAADPRVEVTVSAERLGWGGNVNRLIAAVSTEFFFLYFHDDVIQPRYCEALVGALRAHPDAASANCTVQTYGQWVRTVPAGAYLGSLTERLVQLWLPDGRGSPLRGLVRRDRVGPDLRLPEGAGGVKLHHAFLARLMAAGESIAVDEPLYLRWQRAEGLTGGWRALPFADLVAGWRADAGEVCGVLDRASFETARHRAVVWQVFVLYAWRGLLERLEKEPGTRLPALDALHERATSLALPAGLDQLVPRHSERIRRFHAAIVGRRARLEGGGRR
jgi:hypothetical protein